MISPDVFSRYAAARVPRYTSYPTAPNFLAAADDTTHRQWLRDIRTAAPVSVYFHIPFCRQMCWYCGCHTTVAARRSSILRYATLLAKEISMVATQLRDRLTVDHVHWGGGTPTMLSPIAVKALNRRFRRSFEVAHNADIGLEIDPRSLAEDVAAAFAEIGVNRASIGVQTFDPAVQEAINRVQPVEVVAAAVRMIRSLGVKSVNLDLIYGLPRQTTASCLATVQRALDLRPDRLAVFGYAHVPSFKPHQRHIQDAALPSASERIDQAQAIAEALVAAGYEQVGLDHFALPGDQLARAARNGTLHRNFQGYTTDSCETLLGFGASAISRLLAGFTQNTTRIPEYYRRLSSGQLPTARICEVSAEDARRAGIIEQLMCNYRADIGSVAPIALVELERDGLIRRTGSLVEIKEGARPLVRAVAAAFDAYLPQTAIHHVTAV